MNLILILREKLDAALAEMRTLTEASEADDRDFTEEEQRQWNELDGQAESLRNRISRLEKQESQPATQRSGNGPVTGRPKPMADPNIGMEKKDLRSYSLIRAINAAATFDWRGAELEKEASEAVAKRLDGKLAQARAA